MTPNQERALAALMTARSLKDAAQEAGIDYRTMRRYMKDPDFLTEYRRITGEILSEARMRAQQSIAPALDTLHGICTDLEAKNGDRIAAARSVLEWASKLTELTDFEERIAALEAAAWRGGKK